MADMEDEYEYSVQFNWWYEGDGDWDDVSPNDWLGREDAERWLKSHDKANTRRLTEGKEVVCRGRLVKRRKAGPVEEA